MYNKDKMAKLVNLIPNNNKPKQNEALEDMDVALPAKVEKFLDRAVNIIKGYNLPRKKEQLVIAKIVDAMHLSTSDLSQAVTKLKKYGVVTRQKTGNAEHDWMGERINEGPATHIRDIDFSGDELEFLMGLINNLGSGQHPWADSKTIESFTIKYVMDILNKNKSKIPSQYKSQQKSVESKLNK